MIRVLLESPFKGDVERNVKFARACMRDCLRRGESPYASHLLYPQVLDDSDDKQRTMGIEAGLSWGKVADATVVYTNLGVTDGMQLGIARARLEGRKVEFRRLDDWGEAT